MPQRTRKYRFDRQSARGRKKGFTLLELAVTLTVILLAATLVVPTIGRLLASSADKEAFNLVAAQLTAARAEAVTRSTYAGIHVQLGAPQHMSEKTYSMVIVYNTTSKVFERAKNFFPHSLPGRMAMGELSTTFITTPPANVQNPVSEYRNLSDARIPDFCAFSVIFSPDGAVVPQVDDRNVRFAAGDPMFNSGNTDAYLWKHVFADNEPGVSAFTLFDYREIKTRDAAARAAYLDDNGQFMPVNMHTGQLFDRL